MKLFKQFFLILVIFLKTGNLLSDNSLFTVNNILIENSNNLSREQLTNKAIKEAFTQLTKKILLKKDLPYISNIEFSNIKDLVAYYNLPKNDKKKNAVSFNVSFDKDKIHNLFYKIGILYSDIIDKEFYILPIFLNKNDVFVFSNNFFYNNWNQNKKDQLVEFILPLENIEIIQIINQSRENLLDIQLGDIFKEYEKKNIAIVIIENLNFNENKIYLKTRIQNKVISKSLNFKKKNLEKEFFNENIIIEIREEIINLVKSQNLIDIRTPSFLNVKLNLNNKNNLVILKSRIDDVDLIESIFVKEFNKDFVNLRIKYLGKLEKLINQLENNKIYLNLIDDQWFISSL